jgi:thioredoxin reductase (NADPH)
VAYIQLSDNIYIMQVIYDVIIIGGGPAGLTAAIYTSRADLKTLVLAGNPPGGQLMLTTDVENFPGFPNGIQGPELIENMRQQAARFGSEIVNENVLTEPKEELDPKSFVITTDTGNTYAGKSVIIATGASAKWLDLESETRLRGKGVSACATCDGFFFKDKVVAVVGAGDAAMEEANYLTRFATKVYVLVRGTKESMRASKIMQNRALDNPKIEFLFNVQIKEVVGDQKVEGLTLVSTAEVNGVPAGTESSLEVQGLFLAIGHTPNTGFLNGFVELDDGGYALAATNTFSNKEGVFIAGDVYDKKYRQAVTAAGFGCMAALEAEKYLEEAHKNN